VDDDEAAHRFVRAALELHAPQWLLDSHLDPHSALRIPHSAPLPDVVLMDIGMPALSEIDCARRLKAALPNLPVIMFTGCSDGMTIAESIMAGACGYLIKPVPPERLVWALGEAAEGRIALCGEAQAGLAQYVRRLGTTRSSLGLSPREHQIMVWAAAGLRNKEIAEELGLSEATVHNQVMRAYKKLGVSTRAEARDMLLPREV
jgi:DNA-binding NarL/FixJ family response regulator